MLLVGNDKVITRDYDPPTPMDEINADGHILFVMSGRAVATAIVNGRVIMEERRLAGIDEERIYAKARELSCKLWERF